MENLDSKIKYHMSYQKITNILSPLPPTCLYATGEFIGRQINHKHEYSMLLHLRWPCINSWIRTGKNTDNNKKMLERNSLTLAYYSSCVDIASIAGLRTTKKNKQKILQDIINIRILWHNSKRWEMKPVFNTNKLKSK